MIRSLAPRTIATAIVLLGAVAGCTQGVSMAQEVQGSSEAAESTEPAVDLPEGFPETIMLPEGTVLRSAAGGMPPEYASRTYLIEASAPGTKAEIASFFQNMLEKKGFEIVDTEEGYATVIWFTTLGLDEASVQVMDGYEAGDPSMFTISMIMTPEPE